MSDKEIKPVLVYKYKYMGSTVIETNAMNLISFIETELKELGVDNSGVKFEVELGVMTQKEIDALPEFDGF